MYSFLCWGTSLYSASEGKSTWEACIWSPHMFANVILHSYLIDGLVQCRILGWGQLRIWKVLFHYLLWNPLIEICSYCLIPTIPLFLNNLLLLCEAFGYPCCSEFHEAISFCSLLLYLSGHLVGPFHAETIVRHFRDIFLYYYVQFFHLFAYFFLDYIKVGHPVFWNDPLYFTPFLFCFPLHCLLFYLLGNITWLYTTTLLFSF